MSLTDILMSPHGAQFTNLFLMDRNSSVMEFYPEGWLKHAGVGQFTFHWLAEWSGMNYQGAWRDPNVNPCPYPGDNRRCMNIYKSGQIGYNETSFSVWARYVLNDAKQRKLDEGKEKSRDRSEYAGGCACSWAVGLEKYIQKMHKINWSALVDSCSTNLSMHCLIHCNFLVYRIVFFHLK